MNVNLNTIHQSGIPAMPTEAPKVGQSRQTEQPAALSITEAVASPDDIEAAKLSDDSFDRNDPLGKLVNAAFSLPPPPFPSMPTS